MRVLHLMAGAKVGGAETFFGRLVIGLEKAGLEQRVISRHEINREKMFAEASVDFSTAQFGGFWDVSTRRVVKKEIGLFLPDIVISWMNRPTRFVPKLPNGNGRVFIHLGSPRGYYPPKYYKECEHLVVTTEDLATFYVDSGRAPNDVSVIPNFVPDNRAMPVQRKKYDTPEDAPLLLALGRFHPNKGFDILLKAMQKLPNHFLWLGGDGPLKKKLMDMSRNLGVSERVRFLGWVLDPGPLYSAADVFICSSRHEPFGNIVIESWLYSTAIVASASEGPSAIIEHGKTGLIVPNENPFALSKAIQELYLNPVFCNKLAAAGRKRYQETYTEKRVIGQYLELFERLIN
ncbi:MAG: glycosyl transferase [Rhodospirillaceae bacterium]|nr:glycosyl transferase [Rhodospirillaceae bacterium]